MNVLLDRLFQLHAKGTTAGTELIAGVTTFITMVYIIFVNPQMMAMTGMDHGGARQFRALLVLVDVGNTEVQCTEERILTVGC